MCIEAKDSIEIAVDGRGDVSAVKLVAHRVALQQLGNMSPDKSHAIFNSSCEYLGFKLKVIAYKFS